MKSLDDLQLQTIDQTSNSNNINNNNKSIEAKISNANNFKQSLSSTSDGTNENNIEDESSMLTVVIKDSQATPVSLKRTQAITDLHKMNTDYSNELVDNSIDSKDDSLDTPTTQDSQTSKSIDYIEENKVLMEGINIRAATLPKLLEILIESFGKFCSRLYLEKNYNPMRPIKRAIRHKIKFYF